MKNAGSLSLILDFTVSFSSSSMMKWVHLISLFNSGKKWNLQDFKSDEYRFKFQLHKSHGNCTQCMWLNIIILQNYQLCELSNMIHTHLLIRSNISINVTEFTVDQASMYSVMYTFLESHNTVKRIFFSWLCFECIFQGALHFNHLLHNHIVKSVILMFSDFGIQLQ